MIYLILGLVLAFLLISTLVQAVFGEFGRHWWSAVVGFWVTVSLVGLTVYLVVHGWSQVSS